jgi:uncharacterized protein (DUF488 family)
MLNRQKVLLSLIRMAGRSIGAIEIFKYAFLLSRNNELAGDFSFYEFVPYLYGPYSFSMARELQTLENYGYISSNDRRISLVEGMEAEIDRMIRDLPLAAEQPVSRLIQQYGRLSRRELLRHVYNSFPSYTVNSKLHELVPSGVERPKPAPIAIYTVGYESKSIDGFLMSILQDGIAAVVDIRANPVSRKYGFAKNTLGSICGKLGIAYCHFPELGISSAQRKDASATDSFAKLFAEYEEKLQSTYHAAVLRLLGAMEARPSVLVCMENDYRFCHRSRLADALATESDLETVHL